MAPRQIVKFQDALKDAKIVLVCDIFCQDVRAFENYLVLARVSYAKVSAEPYRDILRKHNVADVPSLWVKGKLLGPAGNFFKLGVALRPHLSKYEVYRLFGDGSRFLTTDVEFLDNHTSRSKVTLFTEKGDENTRRLTRKLAKLNIPYKEIDAEPYRCALLQRTGRVSLPSIWVNKRYIGGAEDKFLFGLAVRPLLNEEQVKTIMFNATTRPAPAKKYNGNDLKARDMSVGSDSLVSQKL